MKVLLTGESGFIGSSFQKKFPGISIPSQFDLLDVDGMKKSISRVSPDFILHLAGWSTVQRCEADQSGAVAVNVGGTQNIVRAIREVGSKARLIFFSTAQVYRLEGRTNPDLAIAEDSDLEPLNFYASTKLQAESVIQKAVVEGNISATILRLFNHVHRSQGYGFLATLYSELLKHLDEKQPVPIPVGNLELVRDLGSIDDLLNAVKSILDQRVFAEQLQVFNICNGKKRKLSDLASLLAMRVGVDAHFELDVSRLRLKDPPLILGSHNRLTTKTGWIPSVVSNDDLINAFLS